MLSDRVYIYGVNEDAPFEFITTELDKAGAKAYAEKFMRLFKGRFNHMAYGTIIEIQSGFYEIYQEN